MKDFVLERENLKKIKLLNEIKNIAIKNKENSSIIELIEESCQIIENDSD